MACLKSWLQEYMVTEEKDTKPAAMNAFELISLSRGLNLSSLFETREVIGIPQPGFKESADAVAICKHESESLQGLVLGHLCVLWTVKVGYGWS
jgi:hypothetical protein